MKYYTLKLFKQENEILIRLKVGDKKLFKHRTTWKLASENWKLKRASLERLDKAEQLYNLVVKCWVATDNQLKADSNYNIALSQYWTDKELYYIRKIKEYCKLLKLSPIWSTYCHIFDSNKQQII